MSLIFLKKVYLLVFPRLLHIIATQSFLKRRDHCVASHNQHCHQSISFNHVPKTDLLQCSFQSIGQSKRKLVPLSTYKKGKKWSKVKHSQRTPSALYRSCLLVGLANQFVSIQGYRTLFGPKQETERHTTMRRGCGRQSELISYLSKFSKSETLVKAE